MGKCFCGCNKHSDAMQSECERCDNMFNKECISLVGRKYLCVRCADESRRLADLIFKCILYSDVIVDEGEFISEYTDCPIEQVIPGFECTTFEEAIHRMHEMLPKPTKENIVELTSPGPGQPKSYIDFLKQMTNEPHETVPVEEVSFKKTEPIVTSRRIKAFPSGGKAKNTVRGFHSDITWDDLGPEYEAILSMTLEDREALLSTFKEAQRETQQRVEHKEKILAHIEEEIAEIQREKNSDQGIEKVDWNKKRTSRK